MRCLRIHQLIAKISRLYRVLYRVPRENDKKKFPVRENRKFGNFVKTQGILSKHRENIGNFVSSSCKCSDSKGKGCWDICCKKNPSLSRSCNSHKLCKLVQGKFAVKQGKHREFESTIWGGTLFLRRSSENRCVFFSQTSVFLICKIDEK